MADAIISVVADRVTSIIEEQIRYEVNLVRGVEKEVRGLTDKLQTIKDVLDDAEKRGVNEKSVKKWLKKLEDVAYEMDDILDEWNYVLLKHKMEDPPKQKVRCSFIPSSSSCLRLKKVGVRRDTAKKIQSVKETLDQILKEKADFNFLVSMPETDYMPKSWRVQSTSLVELENVHGWDINRNKNDIVRKLMVKGDSQLVVSIVGMGGIGKTTLAQLVYNDNRVKDCFDVRIWICVSDPFDVAGIARGIVDNVETQSIPPNTNQLDVAGTIRGIVDSVTTHNIPQGSNQLELVLQKLRDTISGKKFLLVLDDVWTEDYAKWEPLRNILKHGAEASKIMVTTRKEGVAKMMGTFDDDIYRPQHLTDEECWSLLRRISHSGRREEECGMFEDVGKKIAKKCKGLPLAAKVLGSLLQCKRSLVDWENVLESEIWRLEKAEVEIFPHLLLSYNELSPTLKRCFSYCSIYPKDYRINAENLIEEWRALGYLGSVIGKGGAKVNGRDYFNDIAMRSLFQNFKQSDEFSEEIEWCKMHDIVHDFALFLRKNDERVLGAPETVTKSCGIHDPRIVSQVQEYRSLYLDKATPPDLCDCVKSVRVLRFKGKLDDPPKGIEKLIHLRWLELSGTELSQEDLQTICRLYFLQTLLLESCSIEEIPSEIGNLVHLRHLDLSKNLRLHRLPESMCSLVELQILNIQGCFKDNRLPEWIDKLKNLQDLLIDDNLYIGSNLPQGVAQLRNLRTLIRFFHTGGGYLNKLQLLKNLNRLAGSLHIYMHFRSSSDLQKLAEDAREAELKSKPHIRSLHLMFSNDNHGKELSLSPSTSSSSPSLWMDIIEGLEPNHNLKELRIMGYEGTRLPQWITSPLYLIKSICVWRLSELSSLPPMGKLPFLEDLHVENLTKMKVLEREFLGPESCTLTNDGVLVAFPQLKKLSFYDMPNWEEWEDITAEEEESGNIKIMPCLTYFYIDWCRRLKKLPRCIAGKKRSRELRIKSAYEYYRKAGKPWMS